MATTASSRRLAIAHDIAAMYGSLPDLRCIVVGGSTARGTADRWSDLDVILTRDTIDLAALDPPPLAALGERFTCVSMHPGTATEQYMLGALKVDVAHTTPAYHAEYLRRAHDEFDISPDVQGTLDGLATAIVLAGADYFAPIQDAARRYPAAYGDKVIASSMFFMPRWVYEAHCLERSDLLQFDCHHLNAQKHLLAILAALNGQYLDTTYCKHVLTMMAHWDNLPPDFASQFTQTLAGDRREALEALSQLIDGTLTLVEAQRPHLDTSRARFIQAMSLAPWEGEATRESGNF